ncbi:MAG TPA: CHAD domain-containing protein [Candidatus Sulfotelmatobacter sp.]|nr:CHAD domain-containing protein [Candidatus Sulfotelmatobacter sp.]
MKPAGMSTVLAIPGSSVPKRGLRESMERVLKELETVRKDPAPDPVHDLRVAIRRCRSVGAVFQEVDPDPAWSDLRRVPRKLFRRLGALRDGQVMDGWVKHLAPEGDPLRAKLHSNFIDNEPDLRDHVLRSVEKFDIKSWTRLEQKLRRRVRLVPPSSLAAQCLAVERIDEARDLHARAQRTDNPATWHELRIGIKRFRYTVENLLPNHYVLWSKNLKRLQDLLGEVHDLDVLAALLKDVVAKNVPDDESAQHKMTDAHHVWQEIIHRERSERVETYRQLTLGKTSLWNDWRHGLPQGKRLAVASMARLRATARATDSRPHRTAKVSRFSITLFDALRRAHAAAAFGEQNMRRVMRAAARLHRVGGVRHAKPARKSIRKAARRFLRELPMPPSWTYEEWDLLGWAVRFHRGPEPSPEHGTFSTLSDEQQKNIQAIAGVLRIARAFRKCGLETCEGLRAEKTPDAVVLHVPGLPDSAENAARLAAAKHLLDTYIGKPLLLKPAVKRASAPIQNPKNVIDLLEDFERHHQAQQPKTLSAASGSTSSAASD